MPREVAKMPVATSSFHQPPSRQATISSGRMPDAIRKRPSTKNTMPRWSMPMEVLSRWSEGAPLATDLLGPPLWMSAKLLWLVCGDEKRRSRSLVRRLSSRAFLCRLMAMAECSPTLPCMVPASPGNSSLLYLIISLFDESFYMHFIQHKLYESDKLCLIYILHIAYPAFKHTFHL